jgi:8-oxo-dGTP pyrophosphatase MutT (NUDIX family)
MATFKDSYFGRLRALVGSRLVLMPGARIVIEDEAGRVLLQKRTDFGLWGLPGGTPEEGDDMLSTIIRETLEETGLVVTDVRPFGFASDPAYETITYPDGDRCQYFSMMYYARHEGGVPRVADPESMAVAWIAPHELPDMLPNMRRSVEAYLRFKASGEFQEI